MAGNRYTHGHHESVLRSHRWRTAENSAAYLLPLLRPGMNVLDVGCGPGTITADLAARVAPGRVLGVDPSADVIEAARASAGPTDGLEFAVGDVFRLGDARFDVVHAHQVLQHLSDPVGALAAMAGACAPGGVVAARDADYGAMAWYPAVPGLDDWLSLYHAVTHANDAEPDAGRRLLGWALAAGFADVTPSASVWCFATDDDRRWWGGLWADRVRRSSFAEQAISGGLADADTLEAIAQAWLDWASRPDGWFLVPHGEVLCRT